MLSYIHQGSIGAYPCFGLEAERQALLAAETDPWQLGLRLWNPIRDMLGLDHVDENVVRGERGEELLRLACLQQPGNPHRVLLTEAARLLAARDWSPLLSPTDDFVVYLGEHDEGWRPKYESLREINPPERLDRWNARWPAGVGRGEDEPALVIPTHDDVREPASG